MGRPGVTYYDVAKTAQILIDSGVSPTIEGIRAKLGSGSNSTIAPLLRRWKEDQNHHEKLVEEGKIPNELVIIVKKLWECMNAKTTDKIASVKTELQSDINELQQQLKNSQYDHKRLEQEHNSLTQKYKQVSSDKLSLEQGITEINKAKDLLAAQVSAQDQQMQEKQLRIEELHRLHKQVQNNLEHYRDSSREQRVLDLHLAEQEKSRLNQEIFALQKNMSEIIKDKHLLTNTTQTLTDDNKILSDNHSSLVTKLDKTTSTLLLADKTIDTNNLEIKKLQQQHKMLNQRLNIQSENNITQEKQIAVQQEQLQQLSCINKTLEDQNKMLANDRWEIAQERSKLLGQMKQLHIA